MDWSEHFEGELILPHGSCQREQLQALPAKRGVYVLFTADEKPITALIAADMRTSLLGRLNAKDDDESSARRADLSQIAACVRWTRSFSRLESDLSYLQLARKIWPDSFRAKLPRRKAWFLALSGAGGIPVFSVDGSDKNPKPGMEKFGPFSTSARAEEYLSLLTDLFDLCRYNSVLKKSPHGQKCAYAQMGRCLAPCDGSMAMADYRKLAASARGFICGVTSEIIDDVSGQMKHAANKMEFEKAAIYRGRLDSAKALQSEKFADVRPEKSLRFLIIQRGYKKGLLRAFVYAGGEVKFLADLLTASENFDSDIELLLQGALKIIDGSPNNKHDGDLMAVITQYLYSTQDYRGLILHIEKLTPELLLKAIYDNSGQLGLGKQVNCTDQKDLP